MSEEDLLDAVVQVSYDVMGVLTRAGARHDLSLTQLRVLAILRDHQPRMAELAEHLGLDRSTISGLIDRAETRGLVERVAHEQDRRSSRVRLTRAGRRLASTLTAEIGAEMAPRTDRLSAAQQRTLADLLERLLGG